MENSKRYAIVLGPFCARKVPRKGAHRNDVARSRDPHEEAHVDALPLGRGGRAKLRRCPRGIHGGDGVCGTARQLKNRERVAAVQRHALAAQEGGEALRLRQRAA